MIKFRSPLEKRVHLWLKAHNIANQYEGQVIRYRTKVRMGACWTCGSTEVYQQRRYTPDFIFPGRDWVLEIKGKLSSPNRTKYLGVQTKGVEIRFLFQRDNTLSKANPMRYSEWATKHGFKYAIGTLPASWFKKRRNK